MRKFKDRFKRNVSKTFTAPGMATLSEIKAVKEKLRRAQDAARASTSSPRSACEHREPLPMLSGHAPRYRMHCKTLIIQPPKPL